MESVPLQLFDQWFAEAQATELNDPNAMALATAGPDGRPSVRMVLLKGHGPEGFVFYTNEGSTKGKQLAQNPRAALLFHWKSLRRQVRIEGEIERVSKDDADRYFASRSRDLQLGAWASDQSCPLDSRETLEMRFEEFKERFLDRQVPRPEFWGGFRVRAERIEFWIDRPHRLHERRLFTKDETIGWSEGLLFP